MQTTHRPRILCVDDESNVLEGLHRTLRRSFEVETAVGPVAGSGALSAALERGEPFSVVVSDLRMPGMDGITFLEHAHEAVPETVRVLLTGHADLNSALEAVNRGAIFRFLIKPCEPAALQQAIEAAAAQYRLVTAERVLLEKTLHGSIRALTEVLALVNPAGFGRAARAKVLAGEMAAALGEKGRWQVEVAAMLSQLGTVTLSEELVEKIYAGRPLTYSQELAAERIPRIACDLIADIPRMEEVGRILTHVGLRYDGERTRPGAPSGENIPLGARLLKLALDFDLLESQGLAGPVALDTLRARTGLYDPALLETLAECRGLAAGQQQVCEIELRAVRSGMVFAEDVRTTSGLLLVARGQEVTERLAERLKNFLHLVEARRQVRVIMPARKAAPAEATLRAAV